jgi:hypothetical protein
VRLLQKCKFILQKVASSHELQVKRNSISKKLMCTIFNVLLTLIKFFLDEVFIADLFMLRKEYAFDMVCFMFSVVDLEITIAEQTNNFWDIFMKRKNTSTIKATQRLLQTLIHKKYVYIFIITLLILIVFFICCNNNKIIITKTNYFSKKMYVTVG